MCNNCWKEYNAPKIDNPRVRKCADLIGGVYDESLSGGGMHIVIDDFNIEVDSIEWCMENSIETDAEKECAEYMLEMTLDERASALALYDELWSTV